jgi:oligopeptide/dipeptide ABC transporter ATP-binding protein
MTEPLLELSQVSLSFELRRVRSRRDGQTAGRQRLRAVDGVDLLLGVREIVGLVGESGSGKSTLARVIAGLYDPDSARMTFAGEPLPGVRRNPALRRRIQMVFQDPYSSLNPRMSVGQHVRELLLVHKLVSRSAADGRCTELMGLVSLPRELLVAYPRQLSGGQRQRVAIARALAVEPDLLVADEPVSALDVSVQAGVLSLLRDLRDQLGLTILFIAHDLAVVRHLCDRVYVMYMGRVVEEAPTTSLFDNPRHPYTVGLINAIPRLSKQVDTEVYAVPADPPSLLHLPSGCRFRTRCPIAQDVCAAEDPRLRPLGSSAVHSAACHFAETWTTLQPGSASVGSDVAVGMLQGPAATHGVS